MRRDATFESFAEKEKRLAEWKPFYVLWPRRMKIGDKWFWIYGEYIERSFFCGEGGWYSLYRIKGGDPKGTTYLPKLLDGWLGLMLALCALYGGLRIGFTAQGIQPPAAWSAVCEIVNWWFK